MGNSFQLFLHVAYFIGMLIWKFFILLQYDDDVLILTKQRTSKITEQTYWHNCRIKDLSDTSTVACLKVMNTCRLNM